MIWTLTNTWVRVMEATESERSWLYDYLVFRCKSFRPRSGKMKFFMEEIRLYDVKLDKFPAGLARTTYKKARDEGLSITISDVRTGRTPPNDTVDLEWLRHHPHASIDPIVHEIDAVKTVWESPRCVLKLPTGAGKGDIAAGIVRSVPVKWLFLVHRASLVDQQMKRFIDKIGETDAARVTCAGFQYVRERLLARDASIIDLVRTVNGVMVDECHSLGAPGNYEVVMACENAYYRVGLTATPHRGDGRSVFMTAALGNIAYKVEAKYLMEIGILSKPNIKFLVVRHKGSDAKTWQGAHGAHVVRNAERNKLLLSTCVTAAKPSLAFVKELKHGKRLCEALEKKGIKTEFVWGAKNVKVRAAAIDRLERGDTEVIVCNVVFQEGVDIPSLRSIIIGTGGASPIATIQRMGRGTRRSDGKSEFEVWDFADLGCGCQDDPDLEKHKACGWLEEHFKKRRRAYEAEGFESAVVDTRQLELTAQDTKA